LKKPRGCEQLATVRDGDEAALLVVDVQVGVMANSWDRERIVANVARVVERARISGVPVIWVPHADRELMRGSDDWQFVGQLVPSPSEVRIEKSYNSAFEDTDLEEELARIGASRLLLSGAATNWCIRATAYGALDRGYDLT
jgi:nicotinamidase-related amidase